MKWISVFWLILGLNLGVNLFAQPVITLDVGGKKKRVHYYEGDKLNIRLADKEKVSGRIDAIYDSSFVIGGRKIELDSVLKVYSVRPGFRYIGAAFAIGGAFYMTIDAFNNIINGRDFVFSQNTVAYAGTAIAIGGVLSYFGTRRTVVANKNILKILDTTPIPIKGDSNETDSLYCPKAVDAVFTKMDLDGCNWVLMLSTGEKLEAMNAYDFIMADEDKEGKPFKVRVEYYVTKSPSICMVGETVVITCFERVH